jgi:hypothetical protein
MRLRSDIWVSAYLRRCQAQGAQAVLRRRGAAEAGAIIIRIDRLDGRSTLWGPAAPSPLDEAALGRRFARLHEAEILATDKIEERLAREIRFDPDLWIVEVEERAGRSFLLPDEQA